jgi:hypothetical protein
VVKPEVIDEPKQFDDDIDIVAVKAEAIVSAETPVVETAVSEEISIIEETTVVEPTIKKRLLILIARKNISLNSTRVVYYLRGYGYASCPLFF